MLLEKDQPEERKEEEVEGKSDKI